MEKEKSLVFDSSSVISLSMNNLLWALEDLGKKFNGHFFIPKSVKHELIDNPINSKKFKLEAVFVSSFLANNVFKILKNINLKKEADNLANLANSIFKAHGENIKIVQYAEMEALALTIYLDANALIVDERTVRLLVEDPKMLSDLLEKKLHTKIEVDDQNLRKFNDKVKKVEILRSVDLMLVAYEMDIFNKYTIGEKFIESDIKKNLLEGILWGLRFKGCSISRDEIEQAISLEGF